MTISKQAGSVTLDMRRLTGLRNQLRKARGAYVKVGVFDSRNATIGAVHEFGSFSNNIPQRSFLLMPLSSRVASAIAGYGEAAWKAAMDKFGLMGVLTRVGVIGEDVVHQAFQTGGFGQWAPLKPRTIAKKGSSAILIDTAQMRQAVTSVVVTP